MFKNDNRMTVILLLLFVLALMIIAVMCLDVAISESETEDAYIICNPESIVNIHANPKKKSAVEGGFYAGTLIHLDGKKKNGFYHCVNVSNETGEGWVSSKYVVFDEPTFPNCQAIVVSKGRLAARASVNGKRIRWLKPGNTVFIYCQTEEWAVTDKGYVKTEYLEVIGDKNEIN